MKGKGDLRSFLQMWTWLSGHPAHDREYYTKHVAKRINDWVNDCPLCNNPKESKCSGCKMLWDCRYGNLCTDPDSPVFRWKSTPRTRVDERICFASQTAVLAIKFSHELDCQKRYERLSQAA